MGKKAHSVSARAIGIISCEKKKRGLVEWIEGEEKGARMDIGEQINGWMTKMDDDKKDMEAGIMLGGARTKVYAHLHNGPPAGWLKWKTTGKKAKQERQREER
jgi:hypothetical protein